MIAFWSSATRSGVSRRSPSGAVKATLAWPPAAAGSSWVSLSSTFCDSVPSIFISELDWMPLTPSRAPITPSTTIHAAMKYQGLE
ncbi:hypothetical protein NYE33_15475 [Paenibacillus sp. FSL R10-2199]|uniref:hypothetical protein n=1 Tax=Paenibacillus sp. FSL R10-2199 TaxID=2975348 RepID=UPI0030FBD014